MQNKKCAVKTILQICPFARRLEGYYVNREECLYDELGSSLTFYNVRNI